jgi:hypothetical protein
MAGETFTTKNSKHTKTHEAEKVIAIFGGRGNMTGDREKHLRKHNIAPRPGFCSPFSFFSPRRRIPMGDRYGD